MIVVKEVEQTCEACPSQWEGITENNRSVYVRYRWGYLSVRVGKEGSRGYDSEMVEVFGKDIGDGFDGVLDYQKLKEITDGFISWPEEEGHTVVPIFISERTTPHRGEEGMEK